MSTMFSKLKPHDVSGEESSLAFIIRNVLSGRHHIELCMVQSVEEETVTVLPMVLGVKVDGSPISNTEIPNIPCWQHQAGTSAVIIKPVVGDVGLLLVSDRDIQGVKQQKRTALPLSDRRGNMADGVYLGAIGSLNGIPTQYIEMAEKDGGITLKSTGGITVEGDLTVTGTIKAEGEITSGTIGLQSHYHGGVEAGAAQTGQAED